VSADQAAIDGAQVQFSYATIAAPTDGRAGVRQVDPRIGATTINPKLLTRAERLQYEGYLRRKQTNAAIMALVRDAVPLKEIVRRQDTVVNLSPSQSRRQHGCLPDTAKYARCPLALSGCAMERGLP
jgi:hypothetical protein